MIKRLRPAWFLLIVVFLWSAIPLRSVAQTVGVIAGIVPPISTNLVGSTITLSATQDMPLITFDYAWAKDGTNLVDDDFISGSLTPVLTISNAQFTNTGNYTVTLSYTGAVQATASATVYVVDQPVIQSVVPVASGSSVTFIANATGGLLSYQWTWQGQPIPGATNSSLTFADAYAQASAGYYSVGITNPIGSTNFSGPALLFTKPTPSGTYQGIFFDTNALATESSGFFQYTLSSSKRSFSGKIMIGANTCPFSGVFSLAHESNVQVIRKTGDPLSLQLQLVATNGTAQVFGSITDGTWVAPVQGNQLFFSSKTPTTLAGKYTLSLLNTNLDPNIPSGSGYGTVTIHSNGVVAMSGLAGDGTVISQSSGLSRTGNWPLYVSMFKGRGRLLGWLHVSRQAGSSIQSDAVGWVKDPGPDKLYPNGFSLFLQPTGSSYIHPVGASVLAFTNAVATISGGDFFSGGVPVFDFVKVRIPTPNTFVAEQAAESLHLSINGGNGVLSGQFIDLFTGLRVSLKAVALQQQKYARGFFISTNSCGSFTLSSGTR